jgi:hypothetical protein
MKAQHKDVTIAADAHPLIAISIPLPADPAATTPTAPGNMATSVSGLLHPAPSQAATCIAAMREQDVAAVEATLVSVREAYRRGDCSAIEASLIDQAALLNELGLKLLKVAGNDSSSLQRIQTYTGLSLRAFDGARKTLAILTGKNAGLANQTNVQVNVGAQTNTHERIIADAP